MPQALTTLSEAERLMQAGSFESAAEILEDIVPASPTIEALYLLATAYLALGHNNSAYRHAIALVEQDPSSAPARDVLAKANLALGQLDSALAEYLTLAALCREQQPAPPEQFSIPAHFALHNIEQLEHILAANRVGAGAMTEELELLRRGLTNVIDKGNGEAPWVSIPGKGSQLLADPPYVRIEEERLPQYLNTAVDYGPIQQAVLAGQKVQVIDDF